MVVEKLWQIFCCRSIENKATNIFFSLTFSLYLSSDSHNIVLCKSINFVHHIFSIYGMLLVFDTSELWLCLVCWAFTWIELLLLLMDDVDTIDHLWFVILFPHLLPMKRITLFFLVDDKCLCVVQIEFRWLYI